MMEREAPIRANTAMAKLTPPGGFKFTLVMVEVKTCPWGEFGVCGPVSLKGFRKSLYALVKRLATTTNSPLMMKSLGAWKSYLQHTLT
jgi:hypothetical protein